MAREKSLTFRELQFCHYYVYGGGNITEAGVKAGFTHNHMDSNGHLFLKRPRIQEEINRLRSLLNPKDDKPRAAKKSPADVVDQIAKHAFAEALDFVEPHPDDPNMLIGKHPDKLTKDQRAAVKSLRVVKHYRDDVKDGVKIKVLDHYEYKYELHDQTMALVNMGRHFGLFDDKLRITSGNGNRFSNLTRDQLIELSNKITKYMHDNATDAEVIEGESSEPAQKMLPDDRGHAGSAGDPVGGRVRSGRG